LHWLHPTFKEITFNNKIKEVCKKMGMEEPAVVQSMYIYKNPGVGSEGRIIACTAAICRKVTKRN
jgi:phytanoyl-CoA hydroxylase